ncbi:MAG: rhamnulokinase [Promethearchaeota archaeon]|jgi:rhamnulokinase
MTRTLAIDLGASSGKIMVGLLENEILTLDEIYRFSNESILINNSLYWDVLRLFKKIKIGLSDYVKKYGADLDSIGIDTWGVDFVLLDENDDLLGPIHHYRNKRTEGISDILFEVVSKEEIFTQTGIQFMPINTIIQLYSMVVHNSPRLLVGKTFLMLPDYFNFLLSGVKRCEYTEASTSQLCNPVKRDWAYDIIKKLNLNLDLFAQIVPPGTILGNIQDSIAKETGLKEDTKVILPPTHDTGSAVAAVPVDMDKYGSGEWAYLSSGTWSLLGVERNEPLINDKVLEYNFTNEGGINNTTRFLKNIIGLWLIQECKKIWDRKEPELSWEKLEQQAEKAIPFQNYINLDDPIFLNPPNMIDAIKECSGELNQAPLETIGQISRVIFENLVFKYKQVFDQLENLTGTKIKILHIIGGGSQNEMVNQFTANALNIPVRAGPSEATSIGNNLSQALALGEIENIKHLRQIVRNSFRIKEYTPKNSKQWNNAYEEYLTILQ